MSTDTLKYQLLIVDDEASIRDSMSMLLEATGYEVRTAEHGLDALLQMKQLAPDLIISDSTCRRCQDSNSSPWCVAVFQKFQ